MASNSNPGLHPAKVDSSQLSEIQSLEKELGSLVVALEVPTEVPAVAANDGAHDEWADLSSEQLSRLQAAEKKLGMVMLAMQG